MVSQLVKTVPKWGEISKSHKMIPLSDITCLSPLPVFHQGVNRLMWWSQNPSAADLDYMSLKLCLTHTQLSENPKFPSSLNVIYLCFAFSYRKDRVWSFSRAIWETNRQPFESLLQTIVGNDVRTCQRRSGLYSCRWTSEGRGKIFILSALSSVNQCFSTCCLHSLSLL